MSPDAALDWLARLFSEPPWICLSWPAVAMLFGTLAAISSKAVPQRLGIVPRTGAGLLGLVTSPFVHANFAHLAANLPPFLVLGALVLRTGTPRFIEDTVFIALAGGFAVWLAGRKATHVGMSGVVFGLLGHQVMFALQHPTPTNLAIGAGVLLFYGGMVAGLASARKASSWEGHFFGLLAGLSKAWLGPLPL